MTLQYQKGSGIPSSIKSGAHSLVVLHPVASTIAYIQNLPSNMILVVKGNLVINLGHGIKSTHVQWHQSHARLRVRRSKVTTPFSSEDERTFVQGFWDKRKKPSISMIPASSKSLLWTMWWRSFIPVLYLLD